MVVRKKSLPGKGEQHMKRYRCGSECGGRGSKACGIAGV